MATTPMKMKAIIEGRRYDTETAICLGEASSSCGYSDFRWWEASLHRTKAGRFFLAGRGGAMTRWAKSVGNGSLAGGHRIEPMSREEARVWAEEHLTVPEVEAAFADVIEDA